MSTTSALVPGGVGAARAELRRVLRERYEIGIDALDDPDLADQLPVDGR